MKTWKGLFVLERKDLLPIILHADDRPVSVNINYVGATNDMERAFQDAHLGLPETVACFRELRESVLLFLMPFQRGMQSLAL